MHWEERYENHSQAENRPQSAASAAPTPRPPTAAPWPPTADPRPPITDRQPPAADRRPPAADRQPLAADRRPPPPTANQQTLQPIDLQHQPSASYQDIPVSQDQSPTHTSEEESSEEDVSEEEMAATLGKRQRSQTGSEGNSPRGEKSKTKKQRRRRT